MVTGIQGRRRFGCAVHTAFVGVSVHEAMLELQWDAWSMKLSSLAVVFVLVKC